jgi:putative salt-induced outer membrane protein
VRFRSVLLLSSLLLPAVIAAAQDSPPPPIEAMWKRKIGFSYLATAGNSDTQTLGLDLSIERRPVPWGASAILRFNRADDRGATTAERYLASARASRSLEQRWDLFTSASVEKDEFSGIDLRTVVDNGFTYRPRRGPRHFLIFDGGASWTNEDRTGIGDTRDFSGALAAAKYEWKFGENSSFSEHAVVRPRFDDLDDWRGESITALTASLTRWFALRLSYELRYRNQPIGGRERTDTTSRAAIVVNF